METHQRVLQISSLALVLLLAGCDFKGKGAKSEAQLPEGVLITENGKPILTCEEANKEFEPIYEKAMEQNAQMKMFAQLTPNFKDQMRTNYYQARYRQMVASKIIEEKGINKDQEYIKERQTLISNVEQFLNINFIIKKYPITVNEDDIKKYYEEHKDEFLISRGGSLASGVSFEKEADAKAFLTKAQAGHDLKAVADKEGLSKRYRSFGAVNNESPLEAPVRTAILKAKKFPTTELVKAGDKSFYVVRVTGTEGQKYASFDEVKGQLEKMLLEKKVNETLSTEGTKHNMLFNEEACKLKLPEAKEAAAPGEAPVAPAKEEAPEAKEEQPAPAKAA